MTMTATSTTATSTSAPEAPAAADRPAGAFTPDPSLFPFESRWFESSVGPVHYVDEGRGRPLLLLHGNPDWSFLYRKMIAELSTDYRCISLDYPGFGLSPHPEGYGYLPSEHAAVVSELVDHLDLNDVVLVAADWGGPIGMDVASRDPDRFTALVLGNTMFFPPLRIQRIVSRVMGTDFAQRQIMQRSLFVRRIMRALLQAPITDAEFAHYDEVAPTPESRRGHAVFVTSILAEAPWLAELERRVDATLLDRPLLRVMGLKDKPLTTRGFLAKWNSKYPDATKLDLPNAGHFWQEDDPEAVADAIRSTFPPVARETTTDSA